MTVLSASGAKEISGTTADGTVGLFTSVLVEGLGAGKADIDGDGQLSMKELHTWLQPRVSAEAQRASRAQTPALAGAGGAELILVWGLGK